MNFNFYVSGIWTDGQGRVTHLYVHDFNKNNIGVKHSTDYIINLIERGWKLATINWNYETRDFDWLMGAEIIVGHRNGSKYLKTVSNAAAKDNLDNMINMKYFNII